VLEEITRLLSKLRRKICKREPLKGSSFRNSKKQFKQVLMADYNEEFAQAFRRQSYNLFWHKVQTLTGTTQDEGNEERLIKSRLPSYRSLVERLLEPDQETVQIFLQSKLQTNINYSLVSDYFNNTAEAFELCGVLLKIIEQERSDYHDLRQVMETIQNSESTSEDQYNSITRQFESFIQLENPFRASPLTLHFQAIQERYEELQRKLDHCKQLDAAAKGMYILHGDLDTMSRLVKLLHDEIEHNKNMMKFCLERRDEKCHHVHQVATLLQKSDAYFLQQLDELEEYVFLCFASINRARSFVVKQIESHQTHS
ncbi:hypothetical protein KI387_004816, partial [Taxus chinensis]